MILPQGIQAIRLSVLEPGWIAVQPGFLFQDCRPVLIDYNHMPTTVNLIDYNFEGIRKMAKKKPQHGGRRDGAGRRQTNPEGPAAVVNASIPSGLVERMDAVATQKGWTRSRAITEAVRLLLKRHERRTGVTIPSAEADPTDRV